VRCLGFEQIVQCISIHLGRAAGTPCLAVEAHQARLGGSLIARAARNEHRARNEWQLVILLQEHDDPVLELNALGLLRLELMQLGYRNLFPRFVLLCVERGRREQARADEDKENL
jgi:hypothetical protein